jgi:hypothetical protein
MSAGHRRLIHILDVQDVNYLALAGGRDRVFANSDPVQVPPKVARMYARASRCWPSLMTAPHGGIVPTVPVFPSRIDFRSSSSGLARRVGSAMKLAPIGPFPSTPWQAMQRVLYTTAPRPTASDGPAITTGGSGPAYGGSAVRERDWT